MKRASFLTRLQFSYAVAVLREIVTGAGKTSPATRQQVPQLRGAVRG